MIVESTPEASGMRTIWLVASAVFLLIACAAETPYNPLDEYSELESTTILDSPRVDPASVAPGNRDAVAHGEYLVELLGCGSCHTNGAFVGDPDIERALAGSRVGIAYTDPLLYQLPGVVYPPNITPDLETGIGGWSDAQIIDSIRKGKTRHGGRLALVMPWGGYSLLSDSDANAILQYLRNIDAVKHRVPDEVAPGSRASEPYVHFGVYEKR